jgi:hypothetical protein
VTTRQIRAVLNEIIKQVTLPALHRFKDLHKGGSCYIFGDGPSVKWFDLEAFREYPSICCGMLPFHKDAHKLDLRYSILLEPWAFVPHAIRRNIVALKDCGAIVDTYRTHIATHQQTQFFVHATNFLSLRGANVNFVFRGLPHKTGSVSDELRRIDVFGGSLHGSLSLAWYLGFRSVYLIGFDAWTIQPARNMHWYERGEGIFFEPTNFATEFFSALKAEMDISTIAAEGESRNVNCLPYLTYTGRPPKFRENNELLEDRYLQVLATYPGYKIYG